jgi:hypothetical protein
MQMRSQEEIDRERGGIVATWIVTGAAAALAVSLIVAFVQRPDAFALKPEERNPMKHSPAIIPDIPLLQERLREAQNLMESANQTANQLSGMMNLLTSCIDDDKRRDLCVTLIEEGRELAIELHDTTGRAGVFFYGSEIALVGEDRAAADD